MRILALLFAAGVVLAACATNPIPEGYTGPIAHIADTVVAGSGRSVDIFYLGKINGRMINNALDATISANQGQGFNMKPEVITRDVPAQQATFTIVGRTHYAAPILELTNKVYQVRGDVAFAPLANESYVVKGVLGPTYSAVWIEDSKGSVVDKKIEVHGSAELGFMQK